MGWTRRSVWDQVLRNMEEYRKEAGARLVALREARGWTQEDLAYHAKISVKTISRYENGHHDGRRSTLRQMARALKVSESDLLPPAPEPLGLGVRLDADDQLNRIEGKLDDILRRLGAVEVDPAAASREDQAAATSPTPGNPEEETAAIVEQEAERLEQQRREAEAKRRGRRASG